MKFKLEVEIEIEDKHIEYMEGALFENGYVDYWADVLYDHEAQRPVIEDRDRDSARYVLPVDWVKTGLEFLIQRDPPYYRLPELLQGHYDGDSLDVLVQAALFKDIVYG